MAAKKLWVQRKWRENWPSSWSQGVWKVVRDRSQTLVRGPDAKIITVKIFRPPSDLKKCQGSLSDMKMMGQPP